MTDGEVIQTPFLLNFEDDNGQQWLLQLHLAPMRGRLECVGIEVRSFAHPEELAMYDAMPVGERAEAVLTTTTLRQIPLARQIARLRQLALETLTSQAAADRFGAEKAAAAAAVWREREKRTGRRPLSDDELKDVAEVYTAAWERGDPPTKAVAEAFGLSYSGASKQVTKAEARGFLAGTTKGRARRGPTTEEQS